MRKLSARKNLFHPPGAARAHLGVTLRTAPETRPSAKKEPPESVGSRAALFTGFYCGLH
jgi:hypothetical protein